MCYTIEALREIVVLLNFYSLCRIVVSCGGRITKDMFDEKLKEIKEKQAEVQIKSESYDKADEKFYITANTVLSLAKRAYKIFLSSEIAEKRQLLQFLLQNPMLDGRNLVYKLKAPFDTVLEANQSSVRQGYQDSNLG